MVVFGVGVTLKWAVLRVFSLLRCRNQYNREIIENKLQGKAVNKDPF